MNLFLKGGHERSRSSVLTKSLRLAAVSAIIGSSLFGVMGCQSGKCKSCIFNKPDKSLFDENKTLGQTREVEPPKSEDISGARITDIADDNFCVNNLPLAPLETSQSNAPKVSLPAPATTSSLESQKHIENTASSKQDPADVPPSLEPQISAPTATESRANRLSFAPATQDHATTFKDSSANPAPTLSSTPNPEVRSADAAKPSEPPQPAAPAASATGFPPDTLEDLLAPTTAKDLTYGVPSRHNTVLLKETVTPIQKTAATTLQRSRVPQRQIVARPNTSSTSSSQAPPTSPTSTTTAGASTPSHSVAPSNVAHSAFDPAAPPRRNVVATGPTSKVVPGMRLGPISSY